MTNEEKILIHFIIYGNLDNQLAIYDITTDLDIGSFGQLRIDIPRILSSQVLAKEYCLGCLSNTDQMSLEAVADCSRCTPEQRDSGRNTLYWLHFIFGLDTEGPERRALHQTLYQQGIL